MRFFKNLFKSANDTQQKQTELANIDQQLWAAQVSLQSLTNFIAARKEQGVTGTENFGGYYWNQDYNATWNTTAKWDIIKQMKNDATIAGILLAMQLPIETAPIQIEPASQDNIDLEIAEETEKVLFDNPSFLWSDILYHIVEMFAFGNALLEKSPIFDRISGRWVFKLGIRLPETIERWNQRDDKLVSVDQETYSDRGYNTFTMNNNRLVLFNVGQRGSYFEGESLLRKVYFNWYSKEILGKIYTLTCQKWGLKAPVIELPAVQRAGDKDAAKNVGETWITHENQYVILPNGFKFHSFGDVGNMPDIKSALQYHNHQIAIAALADFLLLGSNDNNHGSYALSTDKSSFFMLSLGKYIKGIEDVFNTRIDGRAVIPDFVDWNWSGAAYPKLKFGKLTDINMEVVSKVLKTLRDGEFIEPTEELRDYILNTMELPTEQTIIKREPIKPEIESSPNKEEELKSELIDAVNNIEQFNLIGIGDAFEFQRDLTDTELRLTNLPSMRDKLNLAKIKAEKSIAKIGNSIISELLQITDGVKNEKLSSEVINIDVDLTHKDYKKQIDAINDNLKTVFNDGVESLKNDLKKQGVKLQSAKNIEVFDEDIVTSLTDTVLSDLKATLVSEWKNEFSRLKMANRFTMNKITKFMKSLKLPGIGRKVINTISRTFNLGRAKAADTESEQIVEVIRSEVMDKKTCKPCQAIDGQTTKLNSVFYQTIANGAFDGCQGGQRCRGVNIYNTK